MIERGANINLRKPFPITITFPGQDGYTFDTIPLKKTYIKYLFSKQIISLIMGILMPQYGNYKTTKVGLVLPMLIKGL